MPITLEEYAQRYSAELQQKYNELVVKAEKLQEENTRQGETINELLMENRDLKRDLEAVKAKPNPAPADERSVATEAKPESEAPATKAAAEAIVKPHKSETKKK